MKKILFAAVALVAMASCATDEVVMRPENKLAIEFDNAFVENSTRAADINASNLADFGVYGSISNANNETGLTFNNTKVYKDGGVYKYSPAQVWANNATYTFVAFAPYTNAQWSYAVTNNQAYDGVITFNNAAAQANQDLLFAAKDRTTGVIDSKPEAVALTFNHMLSRVKFHFTNSFHAGSNVDLEVTNVKITNAHSTGELAVNDGQVGDWTVGTETFEHRFGNLNNASLAENGGNGETEHFYLIPTAAEYTVTFTVKMTVADGASFTYDHTAFLNINMEKGHSYVVKTSLNQTNTDPQGEMYAIEFKVDAVEEWENFSDVAFKPATSVATAQELAAAVAEGGEIRLTQDINLDEIMVTRASTYGLFIENDCVIDGNGYTITTSASRGIAVSGANDVTLKNFELVASKAERGIQVQGGAKKVTIENVTAVSSNYTVNLPSSAGATVVTINNCDLKGLNTVNVAAPGSKVTVNNTTLRCEDNADEGYSVVCINKDAVGATVTVNGGEVIITGSNPDGTCGGSIEATDATLTFNETKGNTTINGYGFAIEYGNYYASFPTFEAALAKALPGETIVLLHDITIESHLTINKNVNLDLNGKTITVDIKGGVGDDAIWVRDNAESVISNGAIRFINEVESTVYASGIFATGTSKVTIKDMDIVAAAEAVFAQANASVEILSGSFKSTEYPQFTLNLKDSARATASIVVKGGKYFNFNPADNAAEGEHTNFVAAGYKSVANGEWYEVVAE